MTSLRDELEAYAATGREAYGITNEIFDGIVAALRRNPHFSNMPLQELELVLADARVDSARRLFDELGGCVRLDDVGAIIDGVRDMSGGILGIDPLAAAYVAGILDGESYIGIKRRLPTPSNHMTSPKYSPCVTLAMTDLGPVQFVAEFCGELKKINKRLRKLHYKPIYVFELENARAVALLHKVLPFLIGKKCQAELTLQLADLRDRAIEHRTKPLQTLTFKAGVNAGSEYRVFGLSDEFIAQCDALYQTSKRNLKNSA